MNELVNDLIETSKTVVVICKTTAVSGITISICTLVPFYMETFCFFAWPKTCAVSHILSVATPFHVYLNVIA